MSIINSSTTGHSPRQEKKFSKKLFIGLAVAAAVAFIVAMSLTKDKATSEPPMPAQIENPPQ